MKMTTQQKHMQKHICIRWFSEGGSC